MVLYDTKSLLKQTKKAISEKKYEEALTSVDAVLEREPRNYDGYAGLNIECY